MASSEQSAGLNRLSGERLGKSERHVLFASPSPSISRPHVFRAARYPRSVRVSLLRATRKLERLGLVETRSWPEELEAHEPRRERPLYRDGAFWEHPEKTRRQVVYRRGVWRTAFGDAIWSYYEDELRGGLPIRWDHRVARAAMHARMYSSDHIGRQSALDKQADTILRSRAAPTEPTKEVIPDFVTDEAGRDRWHRSIAAAVKARPGAGSATLWELAQDLYRSDEDLPPARRRRTKTDAFIESRRQLIGPPSLNE